MSLQLTRMKLTAVLTCVLSHAEIPAFALNAENKVSGREGFIGPTAVKLPWMTFENSPPASDQCSTTIMQFGITIGGGVGGRVICALPPFYKCAEASWVLEVHTSILPCSF